jgi:hypothetical protein
MGRLGGVELVGADAGEEGGDLAGGELGTGRTSRRAATEISRAPRFMRRVRISLMFTERRADTETAGQKP